MCPARCAYLDADGRDVSGETVVRAVVDVTAEEVFTASSRRDPVIRGPVVRVNLFRRKAGWRWTEGGIPALENLVAVETARQHLYALRAVFLDGLTLDRNPSAPTEPRLRPRTRGVLVPGSVIGTITCRKHEHPVYGEIVVEAV